MTRTTPTFDKWYPTAQWWHGGKRRDAFHTLWRQARVAFTAAETVEMLDYAIGAVAPNRASDR